MDKHGITYGHAAAGKTARGFEYATQSVQNVTVTTEDLVISVYQPKSKFITTLFEPQSKLPDSATYDITAWNLMYAYGFKAYALNDRITVGKAYQPKPVDNSAIAAKPYAYIFKYKSLRDVEFLAALLTKNVKVRLAIQAFTVSGETFDAGTLIVPQRNNESVPGFDNLVQTLANQMDRKMYTTTTGFVDAGKDFGSDYVAYLKAPNVAMLTGDQTYSLSVGEIWHFFEQQLHYPVTQIGTDYFKSVELHKYDVLVVPEGNYRLFDEKTLGDVSNWVSNGGRLIVLANALHAFVDQKGFGLKLYTNEDEKKAMEKQETTQKEKEGLLTYSAAERKSISEFMPGAIYKTTLDKSHPLAFGLGDTYYSLRENSLRFGYLEDGWNVGIIKGKAKPIQGFTGFKANRKLDNSLVFGVEDKGQGQVIYFVDNPLFRCFWENGKMAFSNAVFLVGGQ